jgi:hypothetical protein
MFDYQLFQNWAGGYHLVNVVYHIINALLLFYLFKYMTNAVWPSALIAGLFALHPLHIESVAWIAERKDVLSTFFWFLAMIAYVKYVKDKNIKWYLSAIFLFIFGLMSKPMLVTLPLVLLLLDYWPLRRKFNKNILLEKIPFFVISVISGIITFIFQQKGGAVADINKISLKFRLDNIIVSYADYIVKMFWPAKLAILYPYPARGWPVANVLISAFILLALTILFIRLSRKNRFFLFGWLFFIGTLVPVIGFIPVGPQSMADRYTYVPLIGLFVIIAFAAKEFINPKYSNHVCIIALIMIIVLSALTSRQLSYWKNNVTLYERTLAVTENNYTIMTNYVLALNEIGQYDKVIEKSAEFLKEKPDSIQILNTAGIALAQTGRVPEAVEYFKSAINYEPNDALAYFNLGVTLQNQNQYEQAVEFYYRALRIQPKYIAASVNLAVALLELNRPEEASLISRDALKYYPGDQNLLGILDEALKKLKTNSGE